MIKRHIEKVITEAIKHFPVILVTGPRQIGKSTLLYNSFLSKGFSYVSLDDQLELLTAKSDPRSFLEIHQSPIIIDEAQKAPELLLEIERIVNKSRLEKGNKESNGLYILSGSQRKVLLDEAKESLSGRVGIIDMNNLSINEIMESDEGPFTLDLSNLNKRANRFYINESEAFQYIVRGFFPVLYDDTKMNTQLFYSSYITTYIEKDIKELINISDEIKFIKFLRILASNIGQELIYENYSNQVGVSANTIKSWIATLEKTAVIYLVEPYNDESIVKRVVKRPKMYFFDTGLAAYLCGIDSAETLNNSFLKGRFFEAFIFNEIKKAYMNAGIDQKLYYYRDTDQNEIDMIIIRNGEISCIEIKTGKNFNLSDVKAFKKFENSKYKNNKNAIICTVEKISALDEKTFILPISSI